MLDQFRKLPLMGIVRGIRLQDIRPLSDIIIASGLSTIEITMNTPDAPKLIWELRNILDGSPVFVGAGTVLSLIDYQKAIDAGAQFIVMPATLNDIISRANAENIPIFPGALTPDEILKAWQVGASMIKVFPSSLFGPAYFKELRGPFNDIPLMACGGIKPHNVGQYLSNGANALAFGGSVFAPSRFINNDYSAIQNDLKALISAYKNSPDI